MQLVTTVLVSSILMHFSAVEHIVYSDFKIASVDEKRAGIVFYHY